MPPAYLHVVAMPMHMQLFIARQFPVKVLGLIHLRNTIRVLREVDVAAPLRLRVHFDTMRLTDAGQEYDFTTRYEQQILEASRETELAQPISEDALLTGPLEPTNEWYAVAKIAGLKLCQAYRRQYGFDAIVAMPTNLYGPGDNFHPDNSHVVPGLMRGR